MPLISSNNSIAISHYHNAGPIGILAAGPRALTASLSHTLTFVDANARIKTKIRR